VFACFVCLFCFVLFVCLFVCYQVWLSLTSCDYLSVCGFDVSLCKECREIAAFFFSFNDCNYFHASGWSFDRERDLQTLRPIRYKPCNKIWQTSCPGRRSRRKRNKETQKRKTRALMNKLALSLNNNNLPIWVGVHHFGQLVESALYIFYRVKNDGNRHDYSWKFLIWNAFLFLFLTLLVLSPIIKDALYFCLHVRIKFLVIIFFRITIFVHFYTKFTIVLLLLARWRLAACSRNFTV